MKSVTSEGIIEMPRIRPVGRFIPVRSYDGDYLHPSRDGRGRLYNLKVRDPHSANFLANPRPLVIATDVKDLPYDIIEVEFDGERVLRSASLAQLSAMIPSEKIERCLAFEPCYAGKNSKGITVAKFHLYSGDE